MPSQQKSSLKQLQPVVNTAQAVTVQAENIVKYTNDNLLPSSIKPTIISAEEKISSVAAPIINSVAAKAEPLLEKIDTQVDTVVKGASAVYESQMEFHAQNLQQFKAAREASLEKVRALIDFLKERGLSGSVQVLVDAVGSQVAKVKALPSYVGEKANEAFAALHKVYEQLLENPTVAKLISTTKPTIDFAVTKYLAVHDTVVRTGAYKLAYDKSVSLLGFAQSTGVYKYASKSLYPYVAPYADPALSSAYYQQLLDHVKPTVA